MGIANISQLSDNIWTGGDLHPSEDVAKVQINEIVSHGITDIMDLRLEWSDEELVKDMVGDRINYHWLGTDDNGSDLGEEFWYNSINTIESILSKPESSVLIHCHMGVNRGPSVAALALVMSTGCTGLEAWLALREARPISWGIYLPEGLFRFGFEDQASVVDAAIMKADAYNGIRESIGKIRLIESTGDVVNQDSISNV